jgi:hypothetical protein
MRRLNLTWASVKEAREGARHGRRERHRGQPRNGERPTDNEEDTMIPEDETPPRPQDDWQRTTQPPSPDSSRYLRPVPDLSPELTSLSESAVSTEPVIKTITEEPVHATSPRDGMESHRKSWIKDQFCSDCSEASTRVGE